VNVPETLVNHFIFRVLDFMPAVYIAADFLALLGGKYTVTIALAHPAYLGDALQIASPFPT
jgi:hypothetical protein